MGYTPPFDYYLQLAKELRMKRIFQIEEQTIEDPSTNLRLEFSSVHTDEVNAGNEPPSKDEITVLRLWTSDRTRMATFVFERNGRFIDANVEAVPGPEDIAGVQPGRSIKLKDDQAKREDNEPGYVI